MKKKNNIKIFLLDKYVSSSIEKKEEDKFAMSRKRKGWNICNLPNIASCVSLQVSKPNIHPGCICAGANDRIACTCVGVSRSVFVAYANGS